MSRNPSRTAGVRLADEISQTLVKDFGWPAGGLAIQQVDAFIAEMKQ